MGAKIKERGSLTWWEEQLLNAVEAGSTPCNQCGAKALVAAIDDDDSDIIYGGFVDTSDLIFATLIPLCGHEKYVTILSHEYLIKSWMRSIFRP